MRLAIIRYLAVTIDLLALAGCKPDDPKAAARNHLQALHQGALNYLNSHSSVWPQPPKEFTDSKDITDWWVKLLADHGVKQSDWRYETAGGQIRFIPATFGELPNEAFKWARSPWFHSTPEGVDQGPVYYIFPDGSITDNEAAR